MTVRNSRGDFCGDGINRRKLPGRTGRRRTERPGDPPEPADGRTPKPFRAGGDDPVYSS
ncbi:MAG: hypothetical protein LBP71_07940 [Spirochaetaceae bacterium]|nr:hypothetical protein [Spirochaetaceae bacterium]